MDTENVAATIPQYSNVCPLCQSEVKLFFINLKEKVLMCKNFECDFPFGYQELQIVTEDSDISIDEETTSCRSKRSFQSANTSVASSVLWSEIEKLTQACDTDNQYQLSSLSLEQNRLHNSKKQNKLKMQKNLKDLQDMNLELLEQEYETKVNIKNEKWIRKLNKIQNISGVQLLKPEEIKLLKKEEPVLGLGELKIDIDPGDHNNMSTINIKICNQKQNDEDNDSKEDDKKPSP